MPQFIKIQVRKSLTSISLEKVTEVTPKVPEIKPGIPKEPQSTGELALSMEKSQNDLKKRYSWRSSKSQKVNIKFMGFPLL